MSHLRVIICRVEAGEEETMTEVASFDLGEAEISQLRPESALDEVEGQVQQLGHQVLRELFKQQWQQIDQQLVRQQIQLFPPGRDEVGRE